MIEFKYILPQSTQYAKFYHEWDLDNAVVAWEDIVTTDRNKFVKFDDGSDLYAKIISCSDKIINTSSGMYRRSDLIHCSTPKINNTSVYGIRSGDVHPAVFPFTRWENKAAYELIKTGETSRSITRRIRMRAQEILGEEAVRQGLTKQVFVSRMIQEFGIREGKNFATAAKFLGLAVFKTDITKPDEDGFGSGNVLPIMQKDTMALYEPEDGNRIATIKDIRKLVRVTGVQNVEKANYVNLKEDEDMPT